MYGLVHLFLLSSYSTSNAAITCLLFSLVMRVMPLLEQANLKSPTGQQT